MMVASNKQHIAPNKEGVMVPTTPDASLNPATKIDLRQIDEQDVKSLQQSDPFMYYSIPAVHKASLLFIDVNHSDIVTNLSRHTGSHPPPPPPPTTTSRPFQTQQETDDHASKVSRRTRVSFECHPRVHMEDIMDELEEEEFDEQLLDDFDIVSMLESRLI